MFYNVQLHVLQLFETSQLSRLTWFLQRRKYGMDIEQATNLPYTTILDTYLVDFS